MREDSELREVIGAGNFHSWTNPYHHPITIRLEPVEGEPINGDEMFVARCEHFPELAMAEGSPGKAYDGLMAMIEKIWVV
ncbi:MAG: hypothetical protein ACI9DC_003428 [Gammaproteobacteria bacterium]